MTQIPPLSLDHMHQEIAEEAMSALQRVYEKGRFVLGEEVLLFESAYADYIGCKHCITCASGLDALILSLRALQVGPGDKVLVPSNTYIATWLAVSAVGAELVPIEPDPDTYNWTAASFEQVDVDQARAMIPVHLYGQACPMTEIMDWADQHGILVVEDNAQAHGACIDGKRTGSFGHINAHSFYPSKNLGALGEGGAMTTDDDALAEQLRLLRNYGARDKYHNEIKGVNSRFDEIQAAFVRVKLRHLDRWNAERRMLAGRYMSLLQGLTEVQLPMSWLDERQVFHLFPLLAAQRDALQRHLAEHGIGTIIHYPIPPHLQNAYQELNYAKGAFPIAEQIALQEISLPLFPGLKTSDVDRICASIKGFYHQS